MHAHTHARTLRQVLAGALNLNMCMLSCNDKDMTDSMFATLLRDAPPNALLMLEVLHIYAATRLL